MNTVAGENEDSWTDTSYNSDDDGKFQANKSCGTVLAGLESVIEMCTPTESSCSHNASGNRYINKVTMTSYIIPTPNPCSPKLCSCESTRNTTHFYTKSVQTSSPTYEMAAGSVEDPQLSVAIQSDIQSSESSSSTIASSEATQSYTTITEATQTTVSSATRDLKTVTLVDNEGNRYSLSRHRDREPSLPATVSTVSTNTAKVIHISLGTGGLCPFYTDGESCRICCDTNSDNPKRPEKDVQATPERRASKPEKECNTKSCAQKYKHRSTIIIPSQTKPDHLLMKLEHSQTICKCASRSSPNVKNGSTQTSPETSEDIPPEKSIALRGVLKSALELLDDDHNSTTKSIQAVNTDQVKILKEEGTTASTLQEIGEQTNLEDENLSVLRVLPNNSPTLLSPVASPHKEWDLVHSNYDPLDSGSIRNSRETKSSFPRNGTNFSTKGVETRRPWTGARSTDTNNSPTAKNLSTKEDPFQYRNVKYLDSPKTLDHSFATQTAREMTDLVLSSVEDLIETEAPVRDNSPRSNSMEEDIPVKDTLPGTKTVVILDKTRLDPRPNYILPGQVPSTAKTNSTCAAIHRKVHDLYAHGNKILTKIISPQDTVNCPRKRSEVSTRVVFQKVDIDCNCKCKSDGDRNKPKKIRYATAKISVFENYSTFEIFKFSKSKPKHMSSTVENVFVIKNKTK
ncbi:hypothetical protein PPYR_07645 [Photinus pyralis]|uniref:Uncharacterized protein n=1 Tax=Photinus pyralis TaxID=7054 RepID=A0A5N4AQY0_PHOPY|nr:uncharacterized protein LOC116169137 [Photinus pyralis]KAB0799765.1 hypothetical protein PPYR_07645 [Photinus pyralis]